MLCAHAPTAPEFVVPPHLFRVLLLGRMRLPITEPRAVGAARHLTLAVSTEPLEETSDPCGTHVCGFSENQALRCGFNPFLKDMNVECRQPMTDASKCWPRTFHVLEDPRSQWTSHCAARCGAQENLNLVQQTLTARLDTSPQGPGSHLS